MFFKKTATIEYLVLLLLPHRILFILLSLLSLPFFPNPKSQIKICTCPVPAEFNNNITQRWKGSTLQQGVWNKKVRQGRIKFQGGRGGNSNTFMWVRHLMNIIYIQWQIITSRKKCFKKNLNDINRPLRPVANSFVRPWVVGGGSELGGLSDPDGLPSWPHREFKIESKSKKIYSP